MNPNTMSTETTTIELLVPDKELPPSLLTSIEAGFKDAFAKAETWRQKALAINVTDVSQTADMKMARVARLDLKQIRVDAEKTRKRLKEDSLRFGRAIDGVNNLLLAAIVPLEEHLEAQEKFGERLIAQQKRELGEKRLAEVSPFLVEGQMMPALDVMTEDQFKSFLADSQLLHEARIEAAKKAEADRIAKEAAEAAERERMRLENEKLKKEVAEREAAAKAEREKAEREAMAAAERARKEREAIEAKAKAERDAAEAKARKEREALEARAKAEREAAAAKIREAEAARAKLEKEAADKRAAEEASKKEAEEKARKAAGAPDKAKLLAFATSIRSLPQPIMASEDGKAAARTLADQVEKFAKWIEASASKL